VALWKTLRIFSLFWVAFLVWIGSAAGCVKKVKESQNKSQKVKISLKKSK
jgi:hypothetical protein